MAKETNFDGIQLCIFHIQSAKKDFENDQLETGIDLEKLISECDKQIKDLLKSYKKIEAAKK